MRIAFLTPEFSRPGFPHGGLANYLAKITAMLKEAGHDPVVFLIGQENRQWQYNNIPVIEVAPYLRRPFWARRWLSNWNRFYQRLQNSKRISNTFLKEHRRNPFDIVHSASYLFPGYTLASCCPVPFIVRVSSYNPLWRSYCGRIKTFSDHQLDWGEVHQLQMADALCAPSKLLAKTLSRLEGLNLEVIRTPFVLPNVDEDSGFYHQHLKGKKYLLFFGLMNGVKGVDLLARALPGVLANHPDLNAVLIGKNLTLGNRIPSFDYIRNQTEGYGERVFLFENLEKAQLFPIIRAAQLVVLPSRIDNYPNTCLEAQALGKIVVGTRDSSLDEMIEDGVTGFLAKNDSVDSLEKQITRALSLSDRERHKMEQRILELGEQRNPEKDLAELLGFYEKTIAIYKRNH